MIGAPIVVRLAVACCASALLGCSGGSGSGSPTSAPSEPSATSTSTLVTYVGDPDSPFCRLVADAESRPVRDPFEPDLDPGEVQVRFRALRLRFAEFATVAPPELAPDLEALVRSLDDLDSLLAANDYDFDSLAASGADMSAFDDPAFVDTASSISAYRTQVCDGGLNNP